MTQTLEHLSENIQPWDVQPNEDTLWYDRFHTFLLLGPARTLTAAFQTCMKTSAPPYNDWGEHARTWQWVVRARLYDGEQARLQRREWEQQRRRNKLARIAMLERFRTEVDNAIPYIDPESATYASIAAAIKIIVSELRNEFDDLPKNKTELSGDVNVTRQLVGINIEDL